MTVFVAILLTVMTIAFIAYPLFRQRQRVAASGGEDRFWELYSRRDATYSMLKELEFDFQSGILTEQDYRDLEARYRGRAISVLRDRCCGRGNPGGGRRGRNRKANSGAPPEQRR